MLSIQVNNYSYSVKPNLSIIEACKYIGIILPRFCYHEKLTVAASCRMCVVEIERLPKPVTACSADILSNIVIFTDTPFLQKARENILEALLLNHPLDCPICDQAGECDLQDQVKVFGSFYSRFYRINKLTVEDKYCGPLIKTIMTRCIMCTRCVRFGSEIAGVDYLGTLNRGGASEIGGYISKLFNSEVSGNVIDLCPVGALTANSYAFKARPWELRTVDSIDVLDNLGSSIYLNFKESEIVRVLPKVNEDINEGWISDKTRFSYDAISSQGRYYEASLNLQKRIININF
jgi:NADH dehydrogenase (ubiquinone) Fe-S protein 1